MVPCECSIEKHVTDAGQSFYVNIYNVPTKIYLSTVGRDVDPNKAFSTGEGRLVCVSVVFLKR